MGYALGYGFGDDLERLIGRAERKHIIVAAALIAALAGVSARIVRSRRAVR